MSSYEERNRPGALPQKKSPRNASEAPSRSTPGSQGPKKYSDASDLHWIWGTHSARAALMNPERRILSIFASRNAAEALNVEAFRHLRRPDITILDPRDMDSMLPDQAVHQGLAVRTLPLADADFEPVCAQLAADPNGRILILDQITDPQNVGALFRAAAAFSVGLIIMQDRKSPPLGGIVAKAAAGALELVPVCRVVNIARSIESLQAQHVLVVGLESESDTALQSALAQSGALALVLGAEGRGLRDLVARKCDRLARIPIAAAMESLNVASAAAISLYEAARSRQVQH